MLFYWSGEYFPVKKNTSLPLSTAERSFFSKPESYTFGDASYNLKQNFHSLHIAQFLARLPQFNCENHIEIFQ